MDLARIACEAEMGHMYINFDFYSSESARVSFKLPNVEDETFHFRVGVIKKENDRLIAYWQNYKSGSEWLTHVDLMQNFREQPLHRGDTIRVEKKSHGGRGPTLAMGY